MCRPSLITTPAKLNIVKEIAYSDGERAKVRCYGADDVREGVAIMHHEGVDVSITGNSTNPTRFQHPVAGTYKKECIEQGKKYFSVASGGGTGRTLHPDNMAAGPASYGMTDTMGRMHSDAQFAGSSSVPAHVEMMGFLGMGNNPMVGATVAVAVAVEEAHEEVRFFKNNNCKEAPPHGVVLLCSSAIFTAAAARSPPPARERGRILPAGRARRISPPPAARPRRTRGRTHAGLYP